MFKKLFGKAKEVDKNIKIYAPLTGEYVKIEDIPDPVFAQKMMGEGFGIILQRVKLFHRLKAKSIMFFQRNMP